MTGYSDIPKRTIVGPLTPVVTTHYIYDLDGQLIAEATGATAATAVIVREYIWLDGMPVMAIDGVNTATPVLMAVHTDHLARPIRMTDAAKAQVWNAVWTPFDAAHSVTGTATQNLRFPGQYFLIEQGLHYNWYRFYDPTTGRYTQPDPLRFVDGPAMYAYAGNSPMMYVDEDGRFAQFIVPIVVGASTGILMEYLFNGDCATWQDYLVAGGVGAAGGVAGRFAYLPWKWRGKWMNFSHSLPDRWFSPFTASGAPNKHFKRWLPQWLNNSLNGSYGTGWRHFKHDPLVFGAPKNWRAKWWRPLQLIDRIPDWIKGSVLGGGTGAAYDGSE